MTTQYTEWLSALGAARKGPIILPAATRGLPYEKTLVIVGNWLTSTLKLQIRSHPDSTTSLAQMTFGTPSLVSGKTIWEMSLSAASINALPPDGDMNGIEYFPYDLLFTVPDHATISAFGGLLPVIGSITRV